MRIRIIFVMFFVSIFSLNISAQYYSTAIGARTGLGLGLTVKHFVATDKAIEVLVGTRARDGGMILTGLFEIQHLVPPLPEIDVFVGAGAHLAIWSNPYWDSTETDKNAYMFVGIDGIVGLEYKFPTAPFTIGFDWKPAFNLIGRDYVKAWTDDIAFSFRYTIK